MPSAREFTQMPKFVGFAELKTPSDLVVKLAHDLDRLVATPHDQYAAFDFFITAEHIVDWLYPNCRKQQKRVRSNCAIIRVTSHIASGAKHFATDDDRHHSVADIDKERYVSEDYVSEDYFASPLMIELEGDEARELGLASSRVHAEALARLVLSYWVKRLGSVEFGVD